MQFPLNWDEFNCSKKDTVVDVALAENHQWAKNELEPWRNYFESYLAGTTRPHTNGDGAVIHFGNIEKYSNYSREYDAYMGVSCDTFQWKHWMRKGPRTYCVLHGTVDGGLPEEFKDRVSWVSPMHPRYFIPSDLPQFPVEEFKKGNKIRICLKSSSPDTSFQFVAEGVQNLKEDMNLVEVVLMGRSKKIPQAFDGLSDLVKLGSEPDFYKFQKMMSKVQDRCICIFVHVLLLYCILTFAILFTAFCIQKCHVLLPLIHPWEEAGKKYFPWSGQGKLSGYMSQAIGYNLPIVVHEEIRDLYAGLLNAPTWVYTTQNSTDMQCFVDAFQNMTKTLPHYLLSAAHKN